MMYSRRFTRLMIAVVGIMLAATAPGQGLKSPSPIGLESKVYFEDGFDGNELADHWEVSNADPDAYIVENGVLLIVATAVGGLDTETTPNLFRLKKDMPTGDWTATVKLSAEFQTGRDWFQFGLFTDATKFVITELYANQACCPTSSLNIRTRKKSGDKFTEFGNVVWKKNLNVQQFADTVPQPITLKLIKEGRLYRSAVSLHGQKSKEGEPSWIETDRVSLLRAPSQLVINASQWEKVSGESLFSIDSIIIEAHGK